MIETLTDNNLTISTRAQEAAKWAQSFEITDDKSALAAGQFLKLVKTLQNEVKKDREDERLKAKATLDAIVEGRNKHLKPLQEAEAIIKRKQIEYEEEKDRQRREEQARIDERRRRELEEAEEAAMLQAAELEEVGAVELAQAVRDTPIEAPAPIVIPDSKPKIEGNYTIVRWKCREVNHELVSRDLLTFNQVAANQAVQTIKNELAQCSDADRITFNKTILQKIAELPNGSVLTANLIGVEIPGVEIYIEKSKASTAWTR